MKARSRLICRSAIWVLATTIVAAPTWQAAAAQLPQDHPWQKVLRDHLATYRAADFAIEDHTFALPDDYAKADLERLYRDWIVLGNLGREPTPAAFHADPAFFTLERIEGPEIRCFPEPAALAWWTQFDFPGNPYFDSKPGKRRALVIAVVDMLMLESAQTTDPRNLKADFMGANLGTWAYTYQHAGALLPPEVQRAYREGMLYFLTKMERIAPRDQNTNMDMREIATLAELSRVFRNEPPMQQRLVREARRILFGDPERGPETTDPRRGTFHAAGYIGEEDGPETSYNGISLYHLAEAAMITRGDKAWDAFMPEVIERMARFKAYNTFPEPDGRYDGPSSWAKRTNAPYTHDQRDRPWRRYAEAILTNESLYRLGIRPGSDLGIYGSDGRERMLADIGRGIQRLNRAPKRPERWNHTQAPAWAEHHWPADLPYTWDHYVPGSYARFCQAAAEGSEWLLPPYQRSENFNIDFDGEFWSVKEGDWGFQVEAVPHMGRGYDVNGSGALAGGSLAAFWTSQDGAPLLGRLPDKWNYVTWDKIDRWPTHHLWGRTAEGAAFSSARQREPWVRFETQAEPPQVFVLGGLGGRRTVEKPDIIEGGYVHYRRTFTKEADGLRIESELLSRRTDQVREVWETLPIFLGPTQRRGGSDAQAQVEFRRGDRWQAAPVGELTADVRAVRIRRYQGSVTIDFDHPQRVLLGEPFVTAYQKKDRLQTLNIDLLGSSGEAVAMPARAAVSYTIRGQ